MNAVSPDDPGILGSGEYQYRVKPGWAQLPPGWSFPDVAAVGVDSANRVYVFCRGEHPVIVLDRDGRFITSWGEGAFVRPHGVSVGPDDSLYLTDDGGHFVRKYTSAGRLLLEIGTPGSPAPRLSNQPFNRCTHTALSPQGDIYVSDGYGNACVHKYDPTGRLLFSWGEFGIGPGQFNLVHNIVTDDEGWVYVADRENHRVQVFDSNGRYETEWCHLHRPSALFMPRGPSPICYVAEGGPYLSSNHDYPNLGPRLTIVSHGGTRLADINRHPLAGRQPGQFISPHGLAVDDRGDIYVGDVSSNSWHFLFPNQPVPDNLLTLQKFERVHPASCSHPPFPTGV
jgi:DNA-binding beta-propeller fold protein YncE